MPQLDHLKPDHSENAEPPSRSPLLFIGKNRRGHWVVQDQSGLLGGLFISRTEACRFAMFENGGREQAIIMVPGILELDMRSRSKTAANDSTAGGNASLEARPNGDPMEDQVEAPAASGVRNA